MLTTVPAVLTTVPAVLAPVAAVAPVAGVYLLGRRRGRGRGGRGGRGGCNARGGRGGRGGRSRGGGSCSCDVPASLRCFCGGCDVHTAGAAIFIVSAANVLRGDRSTLRLIGGNAVGCDTADKIGATLIEENVEEALAPIQVDHHANAIIVLGAVQVHTGIVCQVDGSVIARTRSSTCACRLGVTFERDRGIRFYKIEDGALAHEVPKAIHHILRYIDRRIADESEIAIGTSAPGR